MIDYEERWPSETRILADGHVTVREIANEQRPSVGSVEAIIHEHLKFHKVSARRVPKQLTDEHKQQRIDAWSLVDYSHWSAIVYIRCCLVVCSIHFVCRKNMLTQSGISSVPTGLCHKCPRSIVCVVNHQKVWLCCSETVVITVHVSVSSQITDSDSDDKFFCGIKECNNSRMVLTV